jgi:hypothetical protein
MPGIAMGGVRRVVVARAVLGMLLCGAIAAAGSSTLSTDSVKIAPLGIQTHSSPGLPPEVQALEAESAPAIFDRDTATEFTAFDASSIVAPLQSATEVRVVKIFGAAPYVVSVQAEVNGGWQAVAGLQNIDLATRLDTWAAFTASTPVTTAKLRFDLSPVAGGNATGLKGIEIWGKGRRVNVRDPLALLTALRGITPPAHARLYPAALAQGVIGAADPMHDDTFAFSLERHPADIKRAYLAYDVLGLAHWVSAPRAINANAIAGGFLLPAGSDWSTQIEAINPAWLVAGENRVTFSVPPGVPGNYTVRNVYLVAEFESGANFTVRTAANQPEDTNPSRHVRDGDLATGWTPYPSGNVRADTPTLTLDFDKPTQLDGLSLYLVNNLRGSVAVEFLSAGAWVASSAAVDTKKFVTGWNSISAPSAGPVDAARLVFSGGQGSSAEIKELHAIGSGVGPAVPAQFVVSYPDAGQYYGRGAYLRGFLQPSANASGAARLFIGSQAVDSADGAFGVVVSKDDVGLGSQGDAEAWTVELRAEYPDGAAVTSLVTLNNHQPAVESTEGNLLPTYHLAVASGQAKKIAYDAAALDIGADALAVETTIGVTPLRQEDLPELDTGMTNVTKGPRRGYRFTPTPHKFKSKIKVTLPYNKGHIPPGLTEDDIRTFYFDTQAGSWKALEVAAIDKQAQTVTSLTDHFTDMINATVTVPDHPQTTSFNPTQIKDIKAADPGAQINLIDAPQPNNMGDARLSYPIEVPPGRQGLQPQLAVSYNSSGGNGWMGMGWDIPMQAITIDTRWGVPRYDAALETETYLLNGEMLTPVAHRGELQPRAAEKVFHARVEGQFRRIVRHGSHPANYWWEITDKNGVKYFYGGDSATNAPQANATLTDGGGNVFLWSLTEVRDPNGNFIKYHGVRVSDVGVAGGSVPGTNLYLQRITYTGHAGVEGPYEVKLVRDRELGETLRTDKQIDARGGFKRVTADLLRRVDVSLGAQLIRRYEFKYNENPYGDNRPGTAFYKTLLTAIVQYHEDGATEFNRHLFTYLDEIRDGSGAYQAFGAASNWHVGDDGVDAGLPGSAGRASALGGNKSTNAGGHLYVGFNPTNPSKTNSIGLKLGYNRSRGETLLAMADMNGDGLPDKVFKGSGAFYYRPNLSGPNGTAQFGAPVTLPTLPALSREQTTSTTFGAEAYPFGLAVMSDRNTTFVRADTYLADVNGDGLTDLVSGGSVLFGFVNAAGAPTFTPNSFDTPVPIDGGSGVDTNGIIEDYSTLFEEMVDTYPLVDSVRRWIAPYSGTVRIAGAVRLIEDTSPERAQYATADGVRVAIQHEGSELWSAEIGPDDYSQHVPVGLDSIAVSRGDRLYFRVQSVFDGAYDQVAWDPEIAYLGVPSVVDVNNLNPYRYQASEDFVFAGRPSDVRAPLTGTLHLGGNLSKSGITTDDVVVKVYRNGVPVIERSLAWDAVGDIVINDDIAVAQADVLSWRVHVDSPIDLGRIQWSPQAHYTAADGVDSVTDNDGNFFIQVRPPYEIDMYPGNSLTAPQAFWTVPASATVTVRPVLGLDSTATDSQLTATVAFTVKRRGALIAKRFIEIVNGEVPSPEALAFSLEVSQGEELFLDFSARHPDVAAVLVTHGVDVSYNGVDFDPVPSALHSAVRPGAFAQPNRGWGVIGYNGNRARATQPIDQSVLTVDESYTLESARVYPYGPLPSEGKWGGHDDNAWVGAGHASSSRLGPDYVAVPRPGEFAGASAVPRMSRAEQRAVGVGIGSVSSGTSRGEVDFLDMNGDRFPDVLGSAGIQYSRPTGGLESSVKAIGLGNIRESNVGSRNIGTSLGSISKTTPSARGGAAPSGTGSSSSSDQRSEMPSLGFGGGLGDGEAKVQYDLIDINGDGLPDKVFENGTVALNLGYGFAPAEPWGGGGINDGTSQNIGLNMGYSSDAYGWGGGLSLRAYPNRPVARHVMMPQARCSMAR